MAEKEKLYLETTVVSYYVSRPSRDVIKLADQLATRDFWGKLHRYEVYVSDFVHEEAERGDRQLAQERREAMKSFPIIRQTDDMVSLARSYLQAGALPAKAKVDAFHLAAASLNEIEYLVTWNCRHLANPRLWRKLGEINASASLKLPLICTPRELLGG